MKFTINIGQRKQHRIEYSRNSFFGTERLLADGQLITSRSALAPSTHFTLTKLRRTVKGSGRE